MLNRSASVQEGAEAEQLASVDCLSPGTTPRAERGLFPSLPPPTDKPDANAR